MTDIEEIQKRVFEFAEKRCKIKNYQLNEEISLIHLMSELGELANQIFSKKAKPEKYDEENLKEEICDVILEALILAKLSNMNLSDDLNKKIEKLRERYGLNISQNHTNN